jgi:mannose-6-phosphate isomerase-like protein (cupin superfamily)
MKGYVGNIEKESLDNSNFRKVLYTDSKVQLVVMSLLPNEDIGEEVHEHLDQFIRVESGKGAAVLEGERFNITDGSAVIVPAGTRHNIINESSDAPMKLYTLYSPPQHAEGTVHRTKAEAQAAEEHYEGN